MVQTATRIDQSPSYQNDTLASQLAEQLKASRPRKDSFPIPARLKNLKEFFQAATHFNLVMSASPLASVSMTTNRSIRGSAHNSPTCKGVVL